MKKGQIILLAVLLIAACKRDDDVYTVGGPHSVAQNTIFRINALSATQVEADTASLIKITLQIAPNADTTAHTIHISTTLGTFTGGKSTTTITADGNGMVEAFLKSGQTGTAQLTFTDQNLAIDTAVTFTAALPDAMTLAASAYTGDTASTFILTSTLFRSPGLGVVSNPATVYYSVTPATASATLVLPPFTNSTAGLSTCSVTNPYKITGSFVIQAKTPKDGGDTLRQNITLIVK